METLWFVLLTVVLGFYVVLDGFDLGAGALHLQVARDPAERKRLLAAIGPFWDGNEVWLLAAGGVLFMAFPKVLASGLSGFYLAIMLILWVLILRGISIEFRSHIEDGMWWSFWDGTFSVASTLAPVLFGAALGNLIRGVPLDREGWFSLSLFESFSPRGRPGTLDWYTLLAGLLALAALRHHGALFLAWKMEGKVRERCLKSAARSFWWVVGLWVAATLSTAALVPRIAQTAGWRPLVWAAAALFLGGLALSRMARRAGRDLLAFIGSGVFLFGLLAATAAAVYPNMIRSMDDPTRSLTVFNAAAPHASLRAGLLWWPAGLLLAMSYFVVLFRLHKGKVQPAEGEGY